RQACAKCRCRQWNTNTLHFSFHPFNLLSVHGNLSFLRHAYFRTWSRSKVNRVNERLMKRNFFFTKNKTKERYLPDRPSQGKNLILLRHIVTQTLNIIPVSNNHQGISLSQHIIWSDICGNGLVVADGDNINSILLSDLGTFYRLAHHGSSYRQLRDIRLIIQLKKIE